MSKAILSKMCFQEILFIYLWIEIKEITPTVFFHPLGLSSKCGIKLFVRD